MIKYWFLLIALIGVCSCASYKEVPYFQNSVEFDGSKSSVQYNLKVKPKDVLTIFLFSGNDEAAVAPFNLVDPRPIEYDKGQIRVTNSRTGRIHHYLVDN